MKKLSIVCVFLFLCISYSQAQENTDPFVRKGRFLLETGYNLLAGFSNGTGATVFVDADGENVTSLGFDGGFFVSENFALKTNFSLLSSGQSISSFGIGAKYYIAGVVPVEIGIRTLEFGDSDLLGSAGIGYAINLAPNIALEPNIGVLVSGDALFEFGFTFAMFL